MLITTDDVRDYKKAGLPRTVEVWPRERLIEAQELLATVPGVTVLIHDQACAAELRRARKRGRAPSPTRRVVINHRVCEGCGDCGDVSNCLSVQPVDTPFGRKTRIDQTTCNLDFSCLDGDCPSFVTIDTRPSRWWRRTPAAPAPPVSAPTAPATPAEGALAALLAADPPPPGPSVDAGGPGDVTVRMVGIGGTGVVTVAQVLGTAAMLDGYHVRGLDQIGLSQKAGPVVSDLHLTRGHDSESSRLGAGQADVLLVFDALVAASKLGVSPSDHDRTVVVGSTSATPPGAAITDPSIDLPSFAEPRRGDRRGDPARPPPLGRRRCGGGARRSATRSPRTSSSPGWRCSRVRCRSLPTAWRWPSTSTAPRRRRTAPRSDWVATSSPTAPRSSGSWPTSSVLHPRPAQHRAGSPHGSPRWGSMPTGRPR